MRYQLVIFDMDGTLTEEHFDFEAIRREIGSDGPILEHIARLPPDQAAAAHAILDRHEWAHAEACGVHDGALDVLLRLAQLRIQTALLTRNTARNAARVLSRHGLYGHLTHIATRDNPPFKPHPDALLNITRKLGVAPEQTLMVGDYLYDMLTAQAAGVDAVLLHMEDGPLPDYAAMAKWVIRRLPDLLPIVERPAELELKGAVR